jgi:hypothetical protein
MAGLVPGLVPAIHVVAELYITRLSGQVHIQLIQLREAGKPLGLLAFNQVGRDKTGHDRVDRFDYFAASP